MKILMLSISLLMVSACSQYKPINASVSPQQTQAMAAQLVLPAQAKTTGDTHSWWLQFNDATLNSLMSQARENNNSVFIASQSLASARALWDYAKRDQLPHTEFLASETRQGLTGQQKPTGGNAINTQTLAQFDSQWEVDLFGRLRNQSAAAKAQTAWAEADLAAVRVSIRAEVAVAYVQLRSAQQQWKIAEENREKQKQTLELTRSFADVGRADGLDIARAQAQYELTQANAQLFAAQINTQINRLAVLTVQPQNELKQQLSVPQNLPNVPAQFNLGASEAIFSGRPDIQKAQQKAMIALAQYNVQVADLYPSIQFSGAVGFNAADWNTLGDSGTDFFSFGPRLRWAAFDMGRVQARIRSADALSLAAVRQLNETLLVALEETDNAMVDFGQEELRRNGLQKAAIASDQAAKAAREKFSLGIGDLSTVLEVERNHLAISAQYAQSEAQLLLNLIRIYKNLGGGAEATGNNSLVRM